MKVIWIEENIDINNNSSLWIFEHIFLINNNFILSKFISKFVENKKINIEDIVKTQVSILATNCLLSYSWEIIDISNSTEAEIVWLLNIWDIVAYYLSLLWESHLLNNKLKLFWENPIVTDYIKFKNKLLKDWNIDFLPEELARKSDMYEVDNQTNKWITINELINLENIEKVKETKNLFEKQKYYPTRSAVRFFLFHFFWFQSFSEERQWTVKLWTIFEPDKYIDKHKYEDKGIILKEWWQYDIIASILQWNNTLWLLSTGSGKSITFLLSWMLKPWVSLIIAPLKSLIDDQYTNLEDKFYLNWITWRLHSWMIEQEKKDAEKDILLWKYKFFYCAPERLQIKSFIKKICENWLQKNWFVINQIIIDEAHCLSERWHDFRFSYLNISLFREYISKKNITKIPIIWLTATASQIVKNDIILYLDIKYIVEESSLNRSNLSLEIINIDEPSEKPKTIKSLLNNKIDYILWNNANLQNKNIWLISEKKDDLYNNAGIIFTIYGQIWRKKSMYSISQSSEWILNYLKEEYKDTNYAKMFFSEAPNFKSKVCPKCSNIDIKEIKKNWEWKAKVYYDHIYERYTQKYKEVERWMYETIEKDKDFWICSNPACLRKSFEETESRYQKPDIKIAFDNIEEEKGRWDIMKNKIQSWFKKNEIWLLIATKWFWMWIDKANIRYIIHATLSWSLESYYQEIWRAWRDKKHSHCVLLFSWPTESCIEKTDNLRKDLPCMKNPSDFQYQNCPEWLSTMCDIARQYKMMISPITIDIKSPKKDVIFLHNYLDTEYFIEDQNNAIIPGVKDKNYKEINIKEQLENHLSTNFSHPLIEFYQLYFFYIENVSWKTNTENLKITIMKKKSHIDNISWSEKMIYRLMTVWLFKFYFKEYKWYDKVIFNITINNDYDKKILDDFLLNKLNIPTSEHKNAYNIDQYAIFKNWLFKQNTIIKDLRKLIYFTYEKIETQRKEMLLNLYESIKKSESECFREEIIWRLSWLKKSSTKWCWFCSWCVTDTRKFKCTNWDLEQDKEIQEENKIIKKQFSWEELTKEEEENIKKYETKFTIEKNIKILYWHIEEHKFDVLTKLTNMVDKNKYNISPLIQKTIESWTYNPIYYLLDAYYTENVKNKKERIEKVFDLIKESPKQKFEIWKWIWTWTNEKKQELLYEIEKQDKNSDYFQVWLLNGSWKIDSENLEKLLTINKALKGFTSN